MDNKVRYLKDILWFFVFWGAIAAIFRLWFGLGATTNLSDAMPWGLWKILNMVAGVALSTCGFTVGFLYYVLKIEKFKPLVRPAILIAFLGYGSSCAALLFDIGLPQSFWHPFVMWNIHSFLFEVFWCVIIYFSVTFIELIPNILERFKADKIVKFLHKISIGVVILGISLSSLHHSSLGSLFLTTPLRLHELWYSAWLPLMFIISAMGAGMMFLIFVKIMYARFYDPKSVFGPQFGEKSHLVCSLDGKLLGRPKSVPGKEMPLLSSLSVITAWILGAYLVLKIYDLFAGGSIDALLAGTWESWLYAVEVILTAVLPIILVAFKKTRQSPYGLAVASGSAAFGMVLYRLDVGIFGYFHDAGEIYFPSLAEWSLSLGVIAAAALALLYISENFTIFDEKWRQQRIARGTFRAAFDSLSRVWTTVLQNGIYRISLLAVFIIPIAFVLLYPPYAEVETTQIEPATGLDVNRAMLLIDGNQSNLKTEFPHMDHQKRLGGDESCQKCHHISMPDDPSTPCARCHRNMLKETMIFDHSDHLTMVAKDKKLGGIHPENHSCYVCHTKGQAKTQMNATQCTECHMEDMKLEGNGKGITFYMYADSYMDAMHKNCIPCHEEEEKMNPGKTLSECSTCHKNRQMLQKEMNKMASK